MMSLKLLVTTILCIRTLLNRIITAPWEGMGDVGSARYGTGCHEGSSQSVTVPLLVCTRTALTHHALWADISCSKIAL